MANILTQDLRELSEDERPGHIGALAEAATEAMRAQYPESEGYKYVRHSYKPFEEWPDLMAHFTSVRKGWRWGFKVSVEPADFQCREANVALVQDTRLGELPLLVGLVGGLIAAILAAVCMIAFTGSWTGRDLILSILCGGLGGGAVLFGVAKALTRPLVGRDVEALSDEEDALGEAVVAALTEDEEGEEDMRSSDDDS